MGKYQDSEIKKEIFNTYTLLTEVGGYVDSKENNDYQFKQFIDGNVRNPKLEYPKLKDYPIESILNHLKSSLNNIEKLDFSDAVKDLYKYSITQRIVKQELLRATIDGDYGAFMECNKKLYGEINENLFKIELMLLKEMVDEGLKNEKTYEYASFLKEKINFKEYDITKFEEYKILKTNIPNEVKSLIQNYINLDIDLPEKENFTSEEIVAIFRTLLEKRGIQKWKVLLSNEYVGVTVSKSNILIPVNRVYDRNRVLRLIPHEIGTHVLRRYNNRANKKYAIQVTFIETREEGLANFIEECYGYSENLNMSPLLRIGLTMGLDGTQRDFRDMFDIEYNILSLIKSLKSIEFESSNLKKDAWANIVKLFRGTDFNSKGICLFRGKTYTDDKVRVKKFILDNPQKFVEIMNLRYDFLDPEISDLINSLC